MLGSHKIPSTWKIKKQNGSQHGALLTLFISLRQTHSGIRRPRGGFYLCSQTCPSGYSKINTRRAVAKCGCHSVSLISRVNCYLSILSDLTLLSLKVPGKAQTKAGFIHLKQILNAPWILYKNVCVMDMWLYISIVKKKIIFHNWTTTFDFGVMP